ncbi:MAG TPA: hypothetical protein PK413_15850 [Thermoanaerobaculia bacterium]|nr:hypothetical protein [Thermoanaerobaculia bacterium]
MVTPARGKAGAQAAEPRSADERLFLELENRWMTAIVKQDLATLESVLAPDCTLTVALLGQPPEETTRAEFFLTDTWVNRGGRWQVVARTSSRPEKEEPAPPPSR